MKDATYQENYKTFSEAEQFSKLAREAIKKISRNLTSSISVSGKKSDESYSTRTKK